MKHLIRRSGVAAALAIAGIGITAGTAEGQPVTQEGLVNVNLSNISVQVPVAIAANICDVNVAVLVSELRDDSATCDADASSDATVTRDGGGPVTQSGLVNVNATNLEVQVPIGVAANICDVNVGVLARQLRVGETTCRADAVSVARVPGQGGGG
jgi:hypothetical protein